MAGIPGVPDPRAATAPLPGVYEQPYASAEAQGAGVGRLVERGAQMAGDFAREAKAKADMSQVLGAVASGKDALNKIILDDQSGYSSLRGADAMAGRQKALEAFDKSMAQARARLTDDQRRMFEPHALSIHEQAFSHVISHEAQEQERYSQAQFRGNLDATMETMQKPAILSDSGALRLQVDSLYQAGIDEARRRYGADASKDAISAVVTPELQKAALGGMQAALAQAEQSGDPTVAQNALKTLGGYLITGHQKQFAGMVEAMTAKVVILADARRIVGGSVESLAVPGGDPVAQVDGAKFAALIAAIPDDAPHREEIVKAAEASRDRLQKALDGAVSKVVSRVLAAGDPDATGDFRLDRPSVSAADRQWLRRVDEKKLIALRDMEDKGRRQTTREDDHQSQRNYNNLITQMMDAKARRQDWGQMSPDEFRSRLLDDSQYPGGFTDKWTKAANSAFAKLKGEIGKPEEPIQASVNEVLKAVFKTNPNGAKDYVGPVHDAIVRFIDSEKQKHNGVAPDIATVRAFGEKELAKGSITKIGEAPGWLDFNSTRLVDFERKPEFAGKQFNLPGAAPIVRGPGGAVVAPPATVADRRPRRTVGGETRVWNGSAWVKE